MRKEPKRGSRKLGQEGMGRGAVGRGRRAGEGGEAGLKGQGEVQRKQSSMVHFIDFTFSKHPSQGALPTLTLSPSTDKGVGGTKSIVELGTCYSRETVALKDALAQGLPTDRKMLVVKGTGKLCEPPPSTLSSHVKEKVRDTELTQGPHLEELQNGPGKSLILRCRWPFEDKTWRGMGGRRGELEERQIPKHLLLLRNSGTV